MRTWHLEGVQWHPSWGLGGTTSQALQGETLQEAPCAHTETTTTKTCETAGEFKQRPLTALKYGCLGCDSVGALW